MSLENWDKLPTTKSKALIEIRTDIQNSFDKIKDVVQELEFEGAFSFDLLNTRLSKGDITTLNSLLENKVENLRKNEQVGTALYYQNTIQSIKQFAGNNILITDISPEWLRRYEKHMLKLGRSYTTIGMYGRAIRTMMNEAKRVGIIKENQYPFGKGKYEIPTGESLCASTSCTNKLVSPHCFDG